jgi:hypothetical protein
MTRYNVRGGFDLHIAGANNLLNQYNEMPFSVRAERG